MGALAKSSSTDVLIVGAGVLGVTLAYWISGLYDCAVTLVDAAPAAGMHTSSRNTGVIHRPFYLDPRKKRVFARTSLVSHGLWERLAKAANLPWKPAGTLNVAVEEAEVRVLERYREWGVENGMEEAELDLLDGNAVRSREPEVRCRAALESKADVSVDFGAFTRTVWRLALERGVKFLGGRRVASARVGGRGVEVGLSPGQDPDTISCGLMVNAAGGGALDLAHSMGLGREYASINFRGEYWVVDEPFASRVTSNIYRPPKFPQYPFLDPHFVVRADGSRQFGRNAVAVPGPYVYSGIGITKLPSFLRRPVAPKAKLLMNRDFVSLLMGEWRSSLSKSAMCDRVRKFVPALRTGMLRRRAVFGVRCSLVDSSGFVPEALLIRGESSAHIVNFNSPGATGAPAFSAMVLEELRAGGMLGGLRERRTPRSFAGWEYRAVVGLL